MAEIVLELLTSYTMSRTAHFAATRGFLIIGRLTGPVGKPVQLMYSASLFWMVPGGFAIFCTVISLDGLLYDKSVGSTETVDLTPIGLLLIFMIPILVFNWLASWLFWTGFVKLAGDL
jgi:hypothetical protein